MNELNTKRKNALLRNARRLRNNCGPCLRPIAAFELLGEDSGGGLPLARPAALVLFVMIQCP